ncbi:hypothetical protein PO909_023518 [Leuciscus waleckii]
MRSSRKRRSRILRLSLMRQTWRKTCCLNDASDIVTHLHFLHLTSFDPGVGTGST